MIMIIVHSAWQRRSSLHERRDSLSLRDVREESQRLQEAMLLSVNTEEDEDDEKPLEYPPITVVPFVSILIFWCPLWVPAAVRIRHSLFPGQRL